MAVKAKERSVDLRCRKGHRARIDFEDPGIRWYCETCHVTLEPSGEPGWHFIEAQSAQQQKEEKP